MPISDNVINFAVNFVRSTRINENSNKITKNWLNWGAGPRASSTLIMAAKAHALINNRTTPDIDDVKHVVKPVLRHRIILTFEAEAEGHTSDDLIDKILEKIRAP